MSSLHILTNGIYSVVYSFVALRKSCKTDGSSSIRGRAFSYFIFLIGFGSKILENCLKYSSKLFSC